jgi:hypothetical protein
VKQACPESALSHRIGLDALARNFALPQAIRRFVETLAPETTDPSGIVRSFQPLDKPLSVLSLKSACNGRHVRKGISAKPNFGVVAFAM